MFAIVPDSIIQDRRLGLSDIRVLFSLLSFTRPDQQFCWPSRETIGQRCGIASTSRISNVLARLVKLGWISITPRQGSNLYRILTPPDPTKPQLPCTPIHTAAVHDGVHAEETREETKKTLTPIVVPVGVGEREREKSIIVPESIPVAIVEAVAVPVAVPEAVAIVEAETVAVAEAVAIVTHLNQITGSHLPTHARSATVQRVVSHLKTFSAEDIRDAITFGAKAFRIPAAMLSPSCLESLVSQAKAERERSSARIDQERAVIASLRPSAPSNREVAKSALAGLRDILRGRTGGVEVLEHGAVA